MHRRSRQAQNRPVAVTAILTLIASMVTVLVATPASAASCPDVVVIGARGSAEPPSSVKGAGPDQFYGIGESLYKNIYQPWRTQLAARVELSPVDYPAVSVASAATGDMTKSIRDGVADTVRQIQVVLERSCNPSPQIVLMGYSQGALVITTALSQLTNQQQKQAIKAVYLIGDPLYNASKSYSYGGKTGNGILTLPVAGYLAGLLAAHGTPASLAVSAFLKNLAGVNAVARPLPAAFASRAYDYCIPQDPMCQPIAAGVLGLAAFITGQPTPHDNYKLLGNSKAIKWLSSMLSVRPFTPKAIAINPSGPSPFGTQPVVSSSCPAGSSSAGIHLANGDYRSPDLPINADGTFAIQTSGWNGNFKGYPPAQNLVTDPTTGLGVWPAEQGNLYFECRDSSYSVTYRSNLFPYAFTNGLALRTSVATDEINYTFEVSPAAPCPIPTNSVAVAVFVYSTKDHTGKLTKTVPATLMGGGNWSPVSITAPVTPDPLFHVLAACEGSDGTRFGYTFNDFTLP
ncbi:cutinase [Nakamurella multipartita DSM 44233]|uniref:Cutinase n=2 Tax=Nakamurella TaxID=53460 RepID=C8XF28_NAKMY|nr:cutinase [Nakamurella multipartita DSM 44233]